MILLAVIVFGVFFLFFFLRFINKNKFNPLSPYCAKPFKLRQINKILNEILRSIYSKLEVHVNFYRFSVKTKRYSIENISKIQQTYVATMQIRHQFSYIFFGDLENEDQMSFYIESLLQSLSTHLSIL